MKKIICLVSILMLVMTVSAQVTWNVKAGVGAAWCSLSDYDDPSSKTHVVGKFGVGMELPLSADFSLMPSLELALKGANVDFQELSDTFNQKLNFTFLQLPVMGAYRFNMSDRLNMVLKAGPYIAYGLSGKLKEDGESWDIYAGDEDIDSAKRLDIGAIIGVDFEINRFVVGVEYEHGFTNLSPTEAGIKNRAVYVTVGYKF